MRYHAHDALQPIIERACTAHHWRRSHGDRLPYLIKRPATADDFERHTTGGASIGLAPIHPGESTTRLAVLDLDSHDAGCDWPTMCEHARRIVGALELVGIECVPFRSSGGAGVHIYAIWEREQDARSVRRTLADVLRAVGYAPKAGSGGVAGGYVEVFPKQDYVRPDGYGSMFILPLARQSRALDPVTLDVLPEGHGPTWRTSAPVPIWSSESVTSSESGTSSESVPVSIDTLRSALAAIPQEAGEVGYDDWRDVVFGVHYETFGSAEGLALAHEFSARSPKYDAAFLETRVWPYITHRTGGVTGGTVLHLAAAHGWIAPIETDEFPDDPPTEPPAARKRFEPYRAVEVTARPAPRYRVTNWIQAEGVGMIYGPSGVGKSFLALHIAACIADGKAIGKYATRKCRVAYIFAESPVSAGVRLKAWQQHHGIKTDMLVIEDAPRLSDLADAALLADTLAQHRVELVVIDTLACAMGEADETNEGFSTVLDRCKRIARRIGGLVLLVHHTGKDVTRGARGGSSLRAGVDVEIEVQAVGDVRGDVWEVAAVSTKVRDAAQPPALKFSARKVEIGMDADLNVVTSLAMQTEAEMPDIAARTRRGPASQSGPVADAMRCALVDVDGGLSETELVEAIAKALPAKDRPTRVTIRKHIVAAFNAGRLAELDGRLMLSRDEVLSMPDEMDETP